MLTGEIGRLMEADAWTAVGLEGAASWPSSLRQAAGLMLGSGFPMFIVWGPDRTLLYNDAYVAILGGKHPWALGRPFWQVWPEVRESIEPIIEAAFAGSQSYFEDMEVTLIRGGRSEPAWFTFSYSPIIDEAGRTPGALCVCVETTASVLAREGARRERDRQRHMFEQAPEFICILQGPEHVFDFVNNAHRRLFNSDDWLGRPIRDAFPELAGQGFYERLDHVYATGERYVADGALVRFRERPGGVLQDRFLNFIFEPMVDEHGQVSGVFCSGFDVTERKRAEEALRDREAELAAALEAGALAVFDFDHVTNTIKPSPQLSAIYGYPEDHVLTLEDIRARYHPGSSADIVSRGLIEAADPKLKRLHWTGHLLMPDGTARWLEGRGEYLRDEQGRAVRSRGVLLDVTERKRAEDRRQLLLHELNHRVKNTLSIVQALAQQSFRRGGDVTVQRLTFERRLKALSAAHNVLTEQSWEPAPLRQIIASAMGAAASLEESRISIRGPDVLLQPQPAVSLSLAVHELCTNAIKYGALSNDTGCVNICWTVEPGQTGPALRLRWRETGGPPVAPVTARGFGSRMIEGALAAELDGAAVLDFRPEGLVCRIDAPLRGLAAGVAPARDLQVVD